MCGICGIYHYRTEEAVSQRLIEDMTAVIRHRGPDDAGFFADGPIGMGMRRLSIIDLDGGAQPISDENERHTTVFNGEIYNFRHLRRQLELCGHVFRTRTDTETIVHGYEEWGFDCLARLNGMFGLAVWVAEARTLVLARDPFGIKPVYYCDDGATVRFGSEIRSLFCDPTLARELDEDSLDSFLTYTYVPSPRTAFRGIFKLPPGHALVCTPAGCSLRRFSQSAPRAFDTRDEATLLDELRDHLERAVSRQMVADVPVGALLSGGVDSTAIATLMTRLGGRPIDTFTVGFEGRDRLDETAFARETARRLGSRHHEVMVSADEYAAFLPDAVWWLEELVATDSTLAYQKVCRLARESVKVVLSGQGADEPFAGYPRHLGERYGYLLRALPPGVLQHGLAPLVNRLPRSFRLRRAVRALGESDTHRRMLAVWTVMDEDLKQSLYRPGARVGDGSPSMLALWSGDVAHLDGLSQMLYMDARLSLADNLLLYGDKLSMAVSLEARVPLLDVDLMHFVEGVPPELKIRGWTRKYILRKAVAKWVPEQVLRRKKIPFQSPIDRWLRTDLTGHVRDVLLSEGSACRLYFAPAALARLIDEHAAGRRDHQRVILSMVVFALWHEQFIRPSHQQLLDTMFARAGLPGHAAA
jgi:asparagine synthase (glutamine-hydrolysing)